MAAHKRLYETTGHYAAAANAALTREQEAYMFLWAGTPAWGIKLREHPLFLPLSKQPASFLRSVRSPEYCGDRKHPFASYWAAPCCIRWLTMVMV